jgi:hypothetical protein
MSIASMATAMWSRPSVNARRSVTCCSWARTPCGHGDASHRAPPDSVLSAHRPLPLPGDICVAAAPRGQSQWQQAGSGRRRPRGQRFRCRDPQHGPTGLWHYGAAFPCLLQFPLSSPHSVTSCPLPFLPFPFRISYFIPFSALTLSSSLLRSFFLDYISLVPYSLSSVFYLSSSSILCNSFFSPFSLFPFPVILECYTPSSESFRFHCKYRFQQRYTLE